MVVFTPLTFSLALTNPVSDCGCFGDAVHLTNWQTFFKNLILLIPSIFLFFKRNSILPLFKPKAEWIQISAAGTIFVLFSFYNLSYLPVIDFLPYKSGTFIPEQMIIPENAEPDKYETTFIYEKDGIQKEFTLEDYPANDTSWVFIDQKSVLVKKGYIPPIHDFVLNTIEDEDITDKILSSGNFTMLMISVKIGELKQKNIDKGFEISSKLLSNGIDVYLVTSSGKEEIGKYSTDLKWLFADETTLKTMIRANPGFMLIREGRIIGKWSLAGLPSLDEIIEITKN
jgi:hypothetical protein